MDSDNVGRLKRFPVMEIHEIHCHATTGGVLDVLGVGRSVSASNEPGGAEK